MSRADLLVLDEPTSGLDPLVQQTVLELVQEARDEGRTVFFCSHILSEVQAVCDRVGIIREGKLIKVESVKTLTEQPYHRLRFRFESNPGTNVFAFEGVRELSRNDRSVLLEVKQNLPTVMRTAASYEIVDIETQPVTLEEVFLAYYGRNNRKNHVENQISAETPVGHNV
jgi:ABC-2 type transport system ATP-binding protein